MQDSSAHHPPIPGSDAVAEIRTTFPRRSAADACAARLVAERLAACVQIDGPIKSLYRWQGAVDSADEFRCICKTSPERAEACVVGILASHEYDNPEVITAIVRASPAYAAWVRESVEPEGRGDA